MAAETAHRTMTAMTENMPRLRSSGATFITVMEAEIFVTASVAMYKTLAAYMHCSWQVSMRRQGEYVRLAIYLENE